MTCHDLVMMEDEDDGILYTEHRKVFTNSRKIEHYNYISVGPPTIFRKLLLRM